MTGTRRNPGRLRRLGPLVALGLVSAAVVAVPTGLGVTPPYSAFAGTTTATVTTTDTSDESGTINHLYANVGVDTGTVTVGFISDVNNTFDSATIDWGDGTTPSAATLTPDGGGYDVTGNHTYAAQNIYSVSIIGLETGEPDPPITFTGGSVDVGPATTGSGSPDDIGQAFDNNAVEGVSASSIYLANVHSFGVCSAEFGVVTIDWGDGGPTSTGTLSADNFGGYYVHGTHTYAVKGTYPVSLSLDENTGCEGDPESFGVSGGSVVVADAGLTKVSDGSLSAVEATATGPGTLGTFHDPGASAGDFTATVCWNDLPSPPNDCGSASVSAAGGDNFNVVGGHTFAEEGTYNPTVSVSDTADSSSLGTISPAVTVSDAALAKLTDGSLTATEGAAMAPATLGTFSDVNTGATAADFTAQVCWNDQPNPPNDCEAATVSSLGGGSFKVVGGHTFAEEGAVHPTVSVNDDGGSTVAISPTIAVGDAALSATGVKCSVPSGKSFTRVVANFRDADPQGATGDYTATISWGDGSPNTAGLITQVATGQWTVTGSHTYLPKIPKQGFSLGITIHDGGGAVVSTTSVCKA